MAEMRVQAQAAAARALSREQELLIEAQQASLSAAEACARAQAEAITLRQETSRAVRDAAARAQAVAEDELRDLKAEVRTSGSFLAEISVRPPQEFIIFIVYKIVFQIKLSKRIFYLFTFENRSTGVYHLRYVEVYLYRYQLVLLLLY